MTKRILFLVFLPLLFSFTKHQEKPWTKCKNVKVYDSSNAKKVETFVAGDPESMVIYFFASMIRKDEKFKEVLPTDKIYRHELDRDLEEYATWKFRKFHLVESQMESYNLMYLKIYFEIEFEGEIDNGTDDVTLVLINGKWVIRDLPT